MLVGLAISARRHRRVIDRLAASAITDTQGAVMPGVSITIRNTATGIGVEP